MPWYVKAGIWIVIILIFCYAFNISPIHIYDQFIATLHNIRASTAKG